MSRLSSTSQSQSFSWPQLYLGVALTTLATLILELSLTRIFSVVFYYHFAFLAISIALFGLGAGGLFSCVLRRRFRMLQIEALDASRQMFELPALASPAISTISDVVCTTYVP